MGKRKSCEYYALQFELKCDLSSVIGITVKDWQTIFSVPGYYNLVTKMHSLICILFHVVFGLIFHNRLYVLMELMPDASGISSPEM